MRKKVIIAVACLVVCTVCLAACGKGKIKEDNGSDASQSDSHASNIPTEGKKESKKLSAAEVKKYQEDCKTYVETNMENNDDNTNKVLESIEAEFADLRDVTPKNYANSDSFLQFARDCAYLDTYLEEDTPGDQVGVEGFKYVKKVLQYKKGYLEALDDFQDFYSNNIEELYDHAYYTGKYVVGESKITAGEYVLFTDNPDGARYVIYKSADSDEVVLEGTLSYNVIIEVKDGECLEISENCKAVPIEDVVYIDEEEATMYKVGVQLDAGTYPLQSEGEGSYQIITDVRNPGNAAQMIKFTGSAEVTVKNGEYLKLDNCVVVEDEEEEE